MAETRLLEDHLVCPSAQPEWKGSVAFGVMTGSAREPRLEHFRHAISPEAPQLRLATDVAATEVFRFAAPCLQGGCEHYQGERCGLATQIVQILPAVTERLAACAVRATCRWWAQEGSAACRRCPQVVTDNWNATPEMKAAAAVPENVKRTMTP